MDITRLTGSRKLTNLHCSRTLRSSHVVVTVIAAPIRNEWPLNCDGSMPALVRVEWRRSSVTNSGPGLVPQNSRYDKRALDLPVSALEICRTG